MKNFFSKFLKKKDDEDYSYLERKLIGREIEELFTLEVFFSSDPNYLKMGYLSNGDFLFFESFDNTEIMNAKPPGKYHYYNWSTFITVKKNTIAFFNKRNEEEYVGKWDYLKETFDEVVEGFKETSIDKYTRMNEEGMFNFDFMTYQLKTYSKQNKPKGFTPYNFMSYTFENWMQLRKISYIKEYLE